MDGERLSYILLSFLGVLACHYCLVRLLRVDRVFKASAKLINERRYFEAERLLSKTPDWRHTDTHTLPVLLACRQNLVFALTRQRKYDEALPIADDLIRAFVDRAPDSPGLLTALRRLAHVLDNLGSYEEAVTPRLEALDFIANHPSEMDREFSLRIDLGLAYMKAGDYDNALPHLLWAAGEERNGTVAENMPNIAARLDLGVLYMRLGEFAEAERLFHEVMTIQSEKGMDTFKMRINFALLRFFQGNYKQSEAVALEALDAAPDEKSRTGLLHTLAMVRIKSNAFTEAEELLLRVESEARRTLPPHDPTLADIRCDLAILRMAQGQLSAADDLLRDALTMLQAKLPADHPLIATALLRTGQLRVKQGRPGEAKSLLESALAIYARKAPKHPETLECRQALEALSA